MNEPLEDTAERPGIPAQRHDDNTAGPVGWVTAHRLLAGQSVGPGADALRALLANAAAPATTAERNPAHLSLLLDAYRQTVLSPTTAAAAASGTAARAARTAAAGRAQRRVGRTLAVKCTGVLLVAAGTGAAAAGTDMLPASIQRVAHHYFGGLGIPGPSIGTRSPSAQAAASPTPQGSGSATAPPGATPLADLITLCGQIPHGAKNWRTGLDAQDQAKLSTAAGGDLKVTSFCAQLLADSGSGGGGGTSATPSPGASGSAAASASPGDGSAGKQGKGKDTHSPSPNPHSTTVNH